MAVLFSWIDYIICIVMLLGSTAIGIYHGVIYRHSPPSEYLLGSKRIGVLPIGMSITASSLAAVPVLGFSAETYYYGITVVFELLTQIITVLVVNSIYLPVLYNLKITSIYEYLQFRFDRKTRLLVSVLYMFHMLCMIPLGNYIPALVLLSQVTGISTKILIPTLCFICVFYTATGGIRTVVWTDVLQFIFMALSMIILLIVGIIKVGGLGIIYQRALESGRLHVHYEFDLTIRDSVWSAVIGHFFLITYLVGINQNSIQKCMSVRSLETSKKAFMMAVIFYAAMTFILLFTGFVIYATYHDCDPLTSKQIEKSDQIYPFYALEVSKNIPGLAGIFITGIVSAGLSTMSAGLNCSATVIYMDFIKPLLKKDMSDQKINLLLKSLIVIIGILSLGLAYGFEQVQNIYSNAIALVGAASGPILGIFTIGMILPMVNSIGAFVGGVLSMCFVYWISLGSQFYRMSNPYSTLPMSVNGCPTELGVFNVTQITPNEDNGFILYKISFYYNVCIGFLTTAVLSIIISWFTRNRSAVVRKDCIAPFMHFLLSKESEYSLVKQTIMLEK